MTPNEPENAEKISNFAIVYTVAFDWPLQPSLAFFIFLKSLMSKKATGIKKSQFLIV